MSWLDWLYANAHSASVWTKLHMLPWAPLMTPIIATVAGIIAFYSICVTRKVARRRAAIDLFLKTDLDKSMLDAYGSFNESMRLLKAERANGTTWDQLEATKEYRNVREYLNIHELIAVGIANKVFDEKTCYHYWSGVLVRHCRAARELIEHAANTNEGAARFTYYALKELEARWEKRLDRWLKRNAVQGVGQTN